MKRFIFMLVAVLAFVAASAQPPQGGQGGQRVATATLEWSRCCKIR